MPTEPSQLARNTSMFTVALVAQKLISFGYFTYLSRLFGPDDVGRYVFALSLTTVFSVLMDVGLANVLTREVARDQTRAQTIFSAALGYKFVSGIVVLGLLYLYLQVFSYSALEQQLVFLAAVVMVLDSFILAAYSVLRGFQTLVYESVGTIMFQLTVATTGVVVSLLTRDVRFFMVALITGVVVNFLFSLSRVSRVGLKLTPVFSLSLWRELVPLAAPFAAAAILTRVYAYVDSLLLSLLSSAANLGYYSVAYKFTFALQFIPTAFSASLFPGFSAYYTQDRSKLALTFMRSLVYLTAISVPLACGVVVLAPQIIQAVYPKFVPATLPLQILMVSLVPLFATFPVGALLGACNRQVRLTVNIGIAAALSVGLNLLAIPIYGPSGASVVSLISTTLLLILGFMVVPSIIVLDYKFLLLRWSRILLAAAGMVLVALALRTTVHFLPNIVLSGLSYVILVVVFKGVLWSELKELQQIMFRKSVT